MRLQLARSVLPAAVVAFIGTADLQRMYKVVYCIVVIQLAVFEPPASMTCPSHATTPDVDEPDSTDQGIYFGPLRPLDWQLLRLAIVLHCIPVCGKLVRAGWYGVTWSWQQLFQARTICLETCEDTTAALLTLGVDWSNELEREQLVVAQTLARLQILQSELAALQAGQFALSDID